MKFDLERSLRKRQNSLVIFGASLIALAIFITPLQHFVELSRPQHYGLSLLVLGSGYLFQCALSWRKLTKLERLCYLTTGLFFESVSIIFIENSWLGSKSTVPTEAQEGLRNYLMAYYLFFGFLMSCLWLWLVYQKTKSSTENKETRDS
ncbi:MAG: hypothetical protein C5B53_01340 [Candidatus Melainabacteria bacterium]|nr:MAG: hypothetical protein C5B53_01340 [Candidatus Melainabacteria bacterium]